LARIDPWAKKQFDDYSRLMEEFGIQRFDASGLPDPPALFRRGIVFGHRGFERVRAAIEGRKPFAVLTGLMPSGPMHIGNKMVMDQVMYFQSLGADVFIAVADIEAYATRGVSFERAEKVAVENYILNYIALGLKPCQIYFQSRRRAVKDLGYILGKKVNWSAMKAIYGFSDDTNMAHVFSPLVQVGDVLHVQLEEYGGPRPTVVPVGVDQDPHIRLTRDIAHAHRLYNVGTARDGRFGVFVKGGPAGELLSRAEGVLRDLGYTKLDVIANYNVIYVDDASPGDEVRIEDALIDAEREHSRYIFVPPCATFHRFMTGLTGGKMSSSVPESAVFLNDEPEVGARKVRAAKTGGRVSAEEQRRLGGVPEECTVFEMFAYLLVDDDRELEEIRSACRQGTLLCGACKRRASEAVAEFLKGLQSRREEARDQVKEYLVEGGA